MLRRLIPICILFIPWAAASPIAAQEVARLSLGLRISPESPGIASGEELYRTQVHTGLHPLVIAWREDFGSTFPYELCRSAIQRNQVPLILWDASHHGRTISLQQIIDGAWDEYILAWATAAQRANHPLLIHPFREFNLETHPWSLAKNGRDGALLRKAFEKIVTLFRSKKASQVRWVWGPSIFPDPAAGWNQWEEAFPGREWVDYFSVALLESRLPPMARLSTDLHPLLSPTFKRLRRLSIKPILLTLDASLPSLRNAGWLDPLGALLKRPEYQQLRSVVFQTPDQRLPDPILTFARNLRKPVDHARQQAEFLDRPSWSLPLFSSQKPVQEIDVARPSVKVPMLADGRFKDLPNDLAEIPFVQLDYPFVTLAGEAPRTGEKFSARARLGWNTQGLLLLFEVEDGSLGESKSAPEDIWNGDSVEICIGPPQVLPHPQPAYGDTFRILVSPGGPEQLEPAVTVIRGSDGTHVRRSEIQFGSQFGIRDQGYRLFGVIPWRSLGFTINPGSVVPFNIALSDGVRGSRIRQYIWAGSTEYYHSTANWGYLRLSAPDSKE
jgi:hypothetical protein